MHSVIIVLGAYFEEKSPSIPTADFHQIPGFGDPQLTLKVVPHKNTYAGWKLWDVYVSRFLPHGLGC